MGDLLRLHLRVPLAYVAKARTAIGQKGLLADVEKRVEALGYRETILVMQDPTENAHLTMLTKRSGGGSSNAATDGVVQIVGQEEVDDPPGALRFALPAVANGSGSWDPGLNPEEIATVRTALAEEYDPRHLCGLAGTLEPWFVVAASRLRLRSAVLEPGAEPKDASGQTLSNPEIDRRKRELDAFVGQSGLPPEIVSDEVKRAASSIVQESPYLKPEAAIAGFPAPVLKLAWALVKVAATRRAGPQGGREDLRVVDAAALRRALPPRGDENFVSPSALQLAMATMKPKVSGVGRGGRVPTLFEAINAGKAGDKITIARARSSMERAQKTLERRRWAEWYRRNA